MDPGAVFGCTRGSEFSVSPTVFRAAGFRFFFFSREESRMHVHAQSAEGEAKYKGCVEERRHTFALTVYHRNPGCRTWGQVT